MQSKGLSLAEAVLNTFIGFLISLVVTYIVFPLYNINVSHTDTVQITIIFTVVSIVRGYLIRRYFNGKLVKL